jgi:AcrR family transcriptional regulator
VKTKTEARRLAILEAAAEVFREVGFDRASMSLIRSRLGGSKATLYNYFPSKEKLFLEVMQHAKEHKLQALAAAPDPQTKDLRQELVEFGRRLLTLPYSPECIATRRLVIAESGYSDFGKTWFEWTTVPVQKRLTGFLRKVMRGGALRRSDPKTAAIHFLSLLESELKERALLGVIESVEPEAIRAAVRRAVDAFLAGYGAEEAAGRATPGDAGASRPKQSAAS